MRSTILTYSELCQLGTFEERYRYLRLNGSVGNATFGFDRWLNQRFYKDPEWIALRRDIIIRDLGCDLGMSDREICGPIMVHHMNPITKEDIIYRSEFLLNPEYLICCSDNTHKAIHYGDESLLVLAPIVRSRNDTCPWRH
jgi:hypothetical protein